MSSVGLRLKVSQTIHTIRCDNTPLGAAESRVFSPVVAVLASLSPRDASSDRDVVGFQIDTANGSVGAWIHNKEILTWMSSRVLPRFGPEGSPVIVRSWNDAKLAAAAVRTDLSTIAHLIPETTLL